MITQRRQPIAAPTALPIHKPSPLGEGGPPRQRWWMRPHPMRQSEPATMRATNGRPYGYAGVTQPKGSPFGRAPAQRVRGLSRPPMRPLPHFPAESKTSPSKHKSSKPNDPACCNLFDDLRSSQGKDSHGRILMRAVLPVLTGYSACTA